MLTADTLPEDPQFVFFALTPEQYEALSLNIAEILRWMREAKWRLDYYAERLPEDLKMEDEE